MKIAPDRHNDGRFAPGAQTPAPPSKVTGRGYGTPTPSALSAIRSETGQRASNQDAAVRFDHGVIVADGMGGLPRGALAASEATRVASEYLNAGGRFAVADARDATALADLTVTRLKRDGERHGPGATVVVAGVSTETGELIGAWMGDSRAFHVPPTGPIVPLTGDHAAPDGRLTRYAGSGDPASTFAVPADAGGLAVVCTDGISGVLDAERIRFETQGQTAEVAAGKLIACAAAAGSTDNLTAAVIALPS